MMSELLKQLKAIQAYALDGKDPDKLTGMLDALMADVGRAQAGAGGLFVNMAMAHRVEELKIENERLTAQVLELDRLCDKTYVAEGADALRKATLAEAADICALARPRAHALDDAITEIRRLRDE